MVLQSELLAAVPGLAHAFSTRAGPDALLGPRGLDLGPDAPPAAWAWLGEQAGLPGAGVARMSQVHGRDVLEADRPGLAGQADALVTRRPGLLLAVRVADCVPVLVVDLDPHGRPLAVAAIHAGWRGLAAQVIPAALASLGPRVAGARRLAAIGPCIGVDAYEVDAAVADGVGAVVPTEVFLKPGRRPGHWQADLRAAAAWQLRQGGVDQVDVGPWCTASDPRLHSHRRDGGAKGRLAGVIGWAAG